MKMRFPFDDIKNKDLIQARIDLEEDLLTVLESHADDLDIKELFYSSITFLVKTLYKCGEYDEAKTIASHIVDTICEIQVKRGQDD